jgi:hypothetical protein
MLNRKFPKDFDFKMSKAFPAANMADGFNTIQFWMQRPDFSHRVSIQQYVDVSIPMPNFTPGEIATRPLEFELLNPGITEPGTRHLSELDEQLLVITAKRLFGRKVVIQLHVDNAPQGKMFVGVLSEKDDVVYFTGSLKDFNVVYVSENQIQYLVDEKGHAKTVPLFSDQNTITLIAGATGYLASKWYDQKNRADRLQAQVNQLSASGAAASSGADQQLVQQLQNEVANYKRQLEQANNNNQGDQQLRNEISELRGRNTVLNNNNNKLNEELDQANRAIRELNQERNNFFNNNNGGNGNFNNNNNGGGNRRNNNNNDDDDDGGDLGGNNNNNNYNGNSFMMGPNMLPPATVGGAGFNFLAQQMFAGNKEAGKVMAAMNSPAAYNKFNLTYTAEQHTHAMNGEKWRGFQIYDAETWGAFHGCDTSTANQIIRDEMKEKISEAENLLGKKVAFNDANCNRIQSAKDAYNAAKLNMFGVVATICNGRNGIRDAVNTPSFAMLKQQLLTIAKQLKLTSTLEAINESTEKSDTAGTDVATIVNTKENNLKPKQKQHGNNNNKNRSAGNGKKPAQPGKKD